MLKSMTGFGRCEIATEEYKISVEMKAVNHRYLDLSIKMPKKFNYFEASIRTLLKQYIQRGKVDLFITYEDYTEEKMALKYNASLAAEYMAYFEKMAEQFHIDNDIRVSDLARYPDVLMIKFAEAFDGNVELNPGLQIVEYLEDGLKIRIDKQMLSEKEAMTELIDKMPVENISIEKQSLEDFIYNLVQK